MNKNFAITLVFMLALSVLAACGGGSEGLSDNPPAVSFDKNAPGTQSMPEDTAAASQPTSQADEGDSRADEHGDSKVADPFFNMFGSGTYHMKAKMINDSTEIIIEQYLKNGMMASLMETEDSVMRTIMRDGKMHMVNDDEKTVIVMPVMQQMGSTNSTAVDTAGMIYIGSGKAEFNGKTLPYDEYSMDGEGKTQFFVDGNKMAGIRTIANEQEMDMVILELDQNVPDSVFEIPMDYERMEL